MPETAEVVSKKPEVRQDLARSSGEKLREKIKAKTKDKFWFVTHALLPRDEVLVLRLARAQAKLTGGSQLRNWS
jgi:hypothetical protein